MNDSNITTKEQFNGLLFIKNNRPEDQKTIAAGMGWSAAKTGRRIKELKELGFIDSSYFCTKEGLKALKPYKTKNAVIMAAGMSSRFAPLSYEKPKGLLKVKGEILIERQIDQLIAAGITDITVVVGYLKEQFYYLKEKYGVSIVVNEDYYRYNNTSTLIRVLDKLDNTYICSSDNYFVDNPFEEYVYDSYYSAVYFPGESDEWGLITSKNGLIRGIDHHPKDMWCMLGHIYFSREFSKTFKKLLKKEYELSDTRDLLWEGFYERHMDELDMYIRKYDADKVLEFDSLEELRAFDDSYINDTGSDILKHIAEALNCSEADIHDISVIKNELPIYPFRFRVNGKWYLYSNTGKEKPGRQQKKDWKLSIFEEFHD